MGTQSRTNPGRLIGGLIVLGLLANARAQTAVVPLLSPAGLAFDATGGVYIAEAGRHVVDRYDPVTGKFVVVAGNGTQGFAGDGGAATAAELDTPQGLALDAAGNLYIADAHNQRVRLVTAATGVITTVAGTGKMGFSGDGGSATAAKLASPVAVALDGADHLFLADAGNHRIRRVTLSTGIIATVAGNGTEGNAGDGGPATAASLDSPGGLAVDAAGNLYMADTHNHRVRLVAAGTISTVAGGLGLPRGISLDASGNVFVADTHGHTILKLAGGTATVLAGTGTEGFAGDNGPATSALLDGPKAAGVSPAGLVTLADTRNQRVRQVDSAGVIHTLAGIGTNAGSLSLSGPAVVEYGTGILTAVLTGATGQVSFYEVSSGAPTVLDTAPFTSGSATFSTAGLFAGEHHLFATYGGDAMHAPAESAAVALTVTPAPVVAAAGTVTTTYGQPIPTLTGALTGVLARDTATVRAVFATEATSLSPVGNYPVTATLTGPAAGNYTVTATGTVAIEQAGSLTSVSSSALTAASGTAITFSARAASSTQGTPTGKISFLDSGITFGTFAVDARGSASVSTTLGVGTHPITAIYAGDTNFLPSASTTLSEVITPVTTPDFALNTTGSTTQTVTGGTAATFNFGIALPNGNLAGPIILSAAGLPTGATASFNPAVIPSGGAVTSFTLTIQTVKPAATVSPIQAAALLAGIAILFSIRRRTRLAGALFALSLLAGCGDRVASVGGGTEKPPVSYPITVTGTSTAASGALLQHAATVTLTVQ